MTKVKSRTVEKVRRLLDEFLTERVESDGGSWPEVSDKDFQALHELFEAIVDAKFERDCDGDSVINFAVVNRKKHMPLHHMPIGYTHKAKSLADLIRIANLHQCKVSGASEQVNKTLWYIRHTLEEAEKKGMTPDSYLAMTRR